MSSAFRRLLASALLLTGATSASAQTATGTVTGSVVERQSGRPIEGVQVRVVGTQRGAQTDQAGQFRLIAVPAGAVSISAQRIGYGASTRVVAVTAGGTATVSFSLAPSATTLEQVTVTATGQSERARQNGAATSTIDSSAITKAAISTFSDALSSRVPGVVVQLAAGETGAGSRIRIRGSNSISLSNDPLLVIDGIRIDNNAQSSAVGTGGQLPSRFNDINPEEIENIEVIKGPAAAALYGTAASNGVIQITTKRGRSGKTRWDTFGELGSLHDVNVYPLNYRAYGHRPSGAVTSSCSLYSRTSGSPTACAVVDSFATNSPIESAGILQPGNRRLTGLSVAGGSDVAQYYLGGEYQKEQNVVAINGEQRLNLRTNLHGQLTKTLDAQVSIGYTNSSLTRPQNDNNSYGVVSGSLLGKAADCFGAIAAMHPAVCGADTVSYGYYNAKVNPYDFFNLDTRQQVQRLTGGVTSNWTPLAWLVVNGTLGGDINHRGDELTLPRGVLLVDSTSAQGYRGVYNANIFNFTTSLNATATYDYSSTMKFTSTVGTQYTDVGSHRTDAFGQGLASGTTSLAGTSSLFQVSETTNDVRTLGFLGREQMAWRDRVFLTAGLRTDRNSAFGTNFSRVYYPSLSGSWVISEEDFFPKISAVSSLRLRAAVGSAGQNPGYLSAEQYYNPVSQIINGTESPAFTIGGAGNIKLKPEKSTERELGFDLGMFADRLNFEYTHYDKTTRDELVNTIIPPSVGASTNRYVNLGRVRNYGNEALVRATLLNRTDVKLDFTVNGAWNSNRIEDLGVDANGHPIPQFTGGFDDTQIFKAGLPAGAYYGRAVSYNDANHDNLIACPNGVGSAGCEVIVADSATYQGSPFPAAEISFTPALSLGSFARITATFDHRSGQKIYNLTAVYRDAYFANGQVAQNPDASNLQLQAAAQAAAESGITSGFIEDASFTKLRQVALMLTIPQSLASHVGANSATLTLAGRNLHTWTKYRGLDPELNSNAQSNYATADFLTSPQVRYFTARLAFAF